MNDAKGCYDQISHPIAVLILMSYDLPQTIACTLISTLQKVVHHIKTGYGCSEAVIFSIGQGSGLGPTLWALSTVAKAPTNDAHGWKWGQNPLCPHQYCHFPCWICLYG